MAELILVALSRPEAAIDLLRAALRAARGLDSVRIEALGVRTPAETMIIPSDEAISAAHLAALQDEEIARVSELRRIFEQWGASAQSENLSLSWIEADGLPASVVATRAQSADLVVIERPRRPADHAQRGTTDAAIFGSHRPVLVVPPGAGAAPIGRRPAIAWKDDGRAIKAVIPALRYFADREALSVLIGYRDGPAPDQLPLPLAERGVSATIHPLPIGSDPFGQLLLAKVEEIGADLLVMGAYAHSPLREMLLGGVTRYVLAHARIPVLMRH